MSGGKNWGNSKGNMEKLPNSRVKEIRGLVKDRTERRVSGLFVVEGAKIVRDAMRNGHTPEYLVMERSFLSVPESGDIIDLSRSKSIPVHVADKKAFSSISSVVTPQGVLAVLRRPVFPERPSCKANATLLLCDSVQDPGNLGGMIRVSLALGVDGVILVNECVDPYSPKSIRSSGGAVLDMPLYECELEKLAEIKNEGFNLLVSCVNGGGSVDLEDLCVSDVPVIVAFGSEGQGMSPEIIGMADKVFHIRMNSDKIESLNVMSAAAISLYRIIGKERMKKCGGGANG